MNNNLFRNPHSKNALVFILRMDIIISALRFLKTVLCYTSYCIVARFNSGSTRQNVVRCLFASVRFASKLFLLAIVSWNNRTEEKNKKNIKIILFDFRVEHAHRALMLYVIQKDGTWLTLSLFGVDIVATHETLHNTAHAWDLYNNARVRISCIVNVSLMCF